MTHQYTNITLSFLPVSHTKFVPDWCCDLFKRQYRRTKMGTPHISEVVNCSAECNSAQLVSSQDGSTIVNTYNWADFFFLQVLQEGEGNQEVLSFQNDVNQTGQLFVREWSDTEDIKIDL